MITSITTLPKRWLLVIFIATILLISMYLEVSNHQAAKLPNNNNIKVFTADWGVGASLVAMDNPPIAIGSKRNYEVRMHTPKLPETVVNAGLKYEPNLELLAQLKLELILYTRFFEEQTRYFDPSIPTQEIKYESSTNQAPKWSSFAASARNIGNAINKSAQTEQYIAKSEQRIIEAGKTIHHHIGDKKLLIVELLDAREIRVMLINHRFSLAANMMNLKIITPNIENSWGSASIPTHQLHKLFNEASDTCLIIIEPTPMMTKYEISHSPIWQRSPFLQPDACVYHIDPIWSWGGIEVMVSFAKNLEKAVATENDINSDYVSLKQLAAN